MCSTLRLSLRLEVEELPEAPIPIVIARIRRLSTTARQRDVASMAGGRRSFRRRHRSRPAPPPASTGTTQANHPPPDGWAADSAAEPSGSSVSPELKGQSELGKEQLQKQEKQRVLGVIPAFNSVYEGYGSSTDSRAKDEVDVEEHDGYLRPLLSPLLRQASVRRKIATPAYGQGVEGYAKRFGANYADTADGNFWGNAILPHRSA